MKDFIAHRSEVHGGGNTWCTDCGKQWDYGDPDPPTCESREHISLIGFLAAQLGALDPDNYTVKRALKYLKRNA